MFKAWTFLWPERSSLRCRVVACMGLVLVGRVFNVLVPLQYKALVDVLYKVGRNAPPRASEKGLGSEPAGRCASLRARSLRLTSNDGCGRGIECGSCVEGGWGRGLVLSGAVWRSHECW